jgi:hypothetical protein
LFVLVCCPFLHRRQPLLQALAVGLDHPQLRLHVGLPGKLACVQRLQQRALLLLLSVQVVAQTAGARSTQLGVGVILL